MDDFSRSVWWDNGTVCLLDQRLLPAQELTVRCVTLEDVGQALRTMHVRDAPAIGYTVAYGIALAAHQQAVSSTSSSDTAQLLERLYAAKVFLDAQCPTAVNLAWATQLACTAATQFVEATPTATAQALAERVLQEAQRIFDEDLAMCLTLGQRGTTIVPAHDKVTMLGVVSDAPVGVTASHPAFDIMPHISITATMTERGVLCPPYSEKLRLPVMASQKTRVSGAHAYAVADPGT